MNNECCPHCGERGYEVTSYGSSGRDFICGNLNCAEQRRAKGIQDGGFWHIEKAKPSYYLNIHSFDSLTPEQKESW